MTINDILALGKMGFTAQQVQQMLTMEKAQQGTPATAPAQTAAPATPAASQPAVPDPMSAMAKQLADLSAKLDTLSVPTAGTVGTPPPVTSVEDIILGLVEPAQAPESPDFTKGA